MMSDVFDQIHQQAQQAQPTQPQGDVFDQIHQQSSQAPRTWLDSLKDFGTALREGVEPVMNLVGGIPSLGGGIDPEASRKAGETAWSIIKGLRDIPERTGAELTQSGSALAHGDLPGAAYHLAGAVPFVGPAAQQVGDDVAAGHYATGFGHALTLLGPYVAPEILAAIKNTPVLPGMLPEANPKVTAALDYLESKGVPANAAAKSGSGFVQQVQKVADTTPIGAVVSNNAAKATTSALASEAADLTSRATPAVPADALYAKFRAAEADPANVQRVQVGTRNVPSSSSILGPNSQPAMTQGATTQPIYQDIPLPVKVGDLKPVLKPIYDQMQWMPAADRDASAGYRAVDKILHGPDYIPASEAEVGLSGIKAMARDGSGRSAGIAKFITPKLQTMIDNAAAQGGPDVVKALQEGRAAAASEMGRDWLQKTFDKQQAEGGFGKEAGAWADWQRLSLPDKMTLFRSPGLVDDIDKFFLGSKKLAENPNPSGSGLVSWVAAQSALAVTHPISGAVYTIGSGALSKMMHSQAGVRALTQGIRVSLDSTAPAAMKAAAANQILKMAGPDAKPVVGPTTSQAEVEEKKGPE